MKDLKVGISDQSKLGIWERELYNITSYGLVVIAPWHGHFFVIGQKITHHVLLGRLAGIEISSLAAKDV